MTVYAFSTENWRRPADEVRFLMGFNETLLLRGGGRAAREGRAGALHRPAGLAVPRRVQRHIDEAVEMTRHNRRMTLNLAFNYGGRAEIVDAVRSLVAAGTPADKITEKRIRQHLYAPDMPDPDFMIRTSGEYRISNFLLWELAYSELIFTDVLWPDFRREHLFDAVREFQSRDRRFGGVATR